VGSKDSVNGQKYVLLVGGVGYVGYNLAIALARAGFTVVVASRQSSIEKRPQIAARLRSLPRTSIIVADKPGDLQEKLVQKGCPVVAYILVGRLTGSRRELWASNVEAPRRYVEKIMESCRDTVVVYTSALAVYGKNAPKRCGEALLEGSGLCSCCKPKSLYAKSKLEAERVLSRLAFENGGRLVLARMGIFAGRRPYHREWRLLLGLAKRGFYVASSAFLNLTTAQSLVSLAALHPSRGEVVARNVVDISVTFAAFTQRLAETLSGRTIPLPLPGRSVVKLVEPLTFGLFSDIAWSLYTPLAGHEPGDSGNSPLLDMVVQEVIAEPPSP
jgi:nucleoside-diphosphate-sugar epimerase